MILSDQASLTVETLLKYPAVFLAGFLVVYLLTPAVRLVAERVGMMDHPGSRRIHLRPTPRGGGVAVFLGFHAVCAWVFLLPWSQFDMHLDRSWWAMMAVASGLLFVVGLLDDYRGIRALFKLTGQVVAALIVFASGWSFRLLLGYDLPVWVDELLTVGWILLFVNAFNLIDGMDGLAAGLAMIAALGMAGGLLIRGMPGDALILVGFIGTCAGFLRYNFHPASIFLGDSGSMLLGFVLATTALGTGSKGTMLASLGVPLMAAGVPLFDVVLAIWRRSVRSWTPAALRHGGETSRLMDADLEHVHHRLLNAGLSTPVAATWLYMANAGLVVVVFVPLLFHASGLGIFLLAFVIGSYVLIRHLARVEVWDSAAGIVHGLRRPPRRAVAVLLYPVLDVVLLSIALAATLAMLDSGIGFGALKRVWRDWFPVWVGVPFIGLFVAKSYRRVWSRARIADFAVLIWGLFMGMVIALALCAWMDPARVPLYVRMAVLYGTFSLPGLVGIRLFSLFVHDVMILTGRSAQAHGSVLRGVLLYGGGNRGIQYLRWRRYAMPFGQDGRRIVGILDDDTNLHGRLVYSYPVLGSLDGLAGILKKGGIHEILLVCDLGSGRRRLLRAVADGAGVAVREWVMECRELTASTEDSLPDV